MTTISDSTHPSASQTGSTIQAVIYLRVSTKEQALRNGEPEGFSIPAQRDACLRKAEQLGATVVETFADRGESAKTAHRPELQRMLQFVREAPIRYVIVHKVDRLARNRADDVQINLELQRYGASLVSCTENIDETPSGALMHGIMSSIAEFYSRNLANEVIKGSVQKAKSGGTLSKAPTGYRNVRRWENGREIRTVEIDPLRGPIMRWAFEEYATGEWSLRQLLTAATDMGLKSNGGPRTPAKPIALANFNRLLRLPYYYGIVTYRGVTYDGAHEPLISKTTFDAVQEVLRAKATAGEKPRVHKHYLRGSVFCGTCGSRLGITNARGRHGNLYPYFFCTGRAAKRTTCTQKAVLIEEVERKIVAEYANHQLARDEREQLETFVASAFAEFALRHADERHTQERRLAALERQRHKLLQAHYAGALPLDLLASEQARLTTEIDAANRILSTTTAQSDAVTTGVRQCLDRLTDCQAAYAASPPRMRRQMNQAIFQRIEITDEYIVTTRYSEQYELLMDPRLRTAAEACPSDIEDLPGRLGNEGTPTYAGRGSSYERLVDVEGLEPPTPAV